MSDLISRSLLSATVNIVLASTRFGSLVIELDRDDLVNYICHNSTPVGLEDSEDYDDRESYTVAEIERGTVYDLASVYDALPAVLDYVLEFPEDHTRKVTGEEAVRVYLDNLQRCNDLVHNSRAMRNYATPLEAIEHATRELAFEQFADDATRVFKRLVDVLPEL